MQGEIEEKVNHTKLEDELVLNYKASQKTAIIAVKEKAAQNVRPPDIYHPDSRVTLLYHISLAGCTVQFG